MMVIKLMGMGKALFYKLYSCDIYCAIEAGWTCAGSTCTEICGDSRNYKSY